MHLNVRGIGRITLAIGAALACTLGCDAGGSSAEPPGAGSKEAGARPSRSAPALLDAVREKYASAKSYADTGVVRSVLKASQPVNQQLPFSTAFERDGRFCWEFRGALMPGGTPNQRYVVWSKDQKAFETYWDLNKQRVPQPNFDMAMAGPTGVSGGSANAIIPILRGKGTPWVLMPATPEDQGEEAIAGVMCRKVGGVTPQGDQVTLWIDPDLAIRRAFIVREVDPTKLTDGAGKPLAGEKFVAETTIEFAPTFDGVIDDAAFEGPAQQ